MFASVKLSVIKIVLTWTSIVINISSFTFLCIIYYLSVPVPLSFTTGILFCTK